MLSSSHPEVIYLQPLMLPIVSSLLNRHSAKLPNQLVDEFFEFIPSSPSRRLRFELHGDRESPSKTDLHKITRIDYIPFPIFRTTSILSQTTLFVT